MSKARIGALAAAAVIVIVYGIAAARDENPGELLVVGAIALVVLAVYWWLAVVRPSARAEGNTPAMVSLVSAIVGAAAIPVWWMGLPFVLGSGAVATGLEGRERAGRGAGRQGLATVGLVLGALLSVFWVIIAFTD